MSQFDKRISVNTIIENQLPEFILADFPNATEFFKQYYISQEFQRGPSDLINNFDQYLKVDNLVPEVVVGVQVFLLRLHHQIQQSLYQAQKDFQVNMDF